MFELAWHNEHLDVSQWIKSYILYRYGKTSLEMETAWELLLKTAYSSPEVYQEGPSESIFCARPAVDIQTVSSWGTRQRNYDVVVYEKAVRSFVAAGRIFSGSQTYETDRVDFVRQVLANKADVIYWLMQNAVKQKDRKDFVAVSNRFQQMIMLQDSLLSSNTYFSLNRWLEQAKIFGTTAADQKLSLWNAKAQITYWGPETNPDTNLRDYAHKEWGGLLSSLYLDRWKKFTTDELAKMDGKTPDSKSYFEMERQWSLSPMMYVPIILTESEINAVVVKIIH